MFARSIRHLAEEVLAKAQNDRLRIATAESCTGGLIAGALTEIPGASDVVDCGFIVYADEAKTRLLGVPEETITRHGAVSEEVARAMVQGALDHSNADAAVAVTGIAGPTGGTALKPIGLVHIAALRSGRPIEHRCYEFGDIGRSEVRMETVDAALKLLLHVL
jgi:nicotinamide-nucleotide amidase